MKKRTTRNNTTPCEELPPLPRGASVAVPDNDVDGDGTTGNEVGDDGDGTTGDDNDADGDGTTGNEVNDDGDGATGDINNDNNDGNDDRKWHDGQRCDGI